ncbi:hypothetical protein PHMEG_00039628 [Phytophthora megakarya]|uniref:Ty3 transposon capsid-like protein domain-containing protein n=1 Tax=Phytophthora megakarya TaxID=4795 RepID=A0A225UFH7_9STRA|nr:hypothetical protein PHMEG_00039628 [Phytophthora megakarya]
MDTKPPLFEGEISGVKLNSFMFQFETYFSFKGYDIQLDDVELGRELAQCVKKSGATWYETYMTSPVTAKTWTAMKISLEKNFKEPNFQQKLRNELLNFKQRGSYQGYVAKFQEKLRLVPIDPVFAKEIFLKGLNSNNLRKQILRKKLETLEDVIAEGFSEVELERLEETKSVATNDKEAPGKTTKVKAGRTSNKFAKTSSFTGKTKCPHCDKGYHSADNCWVKYPEKRPKLADNGKTKRASNDSTDYKSKYYALIDKLVVNDVDTTDEPLNE